MDATDLEHSCWDCAHRVVCAVFQSTTKSELLNTDFVDGDGHARLNELVFGALAKECCHFMLDMNKYPPPPPMG